MSKRQPEKFCYFCGGTASGQEHVPPRGFFPKSKDVAGDVDFRKALITVPACWHHNNNYSKDDEVAGYIILLHQNANPVAGVQFESKAMRAFARSKSLINKVFLSMSPARHSSGQETAAVTIDEKLLSRVMEKIARGLYFHKHDRPWGVELFMVGDLLMSDLTPGPFARHMTALRWHFDRLPREGAVPEVFWWQEIEIEDGRHIVRMVFYGGLEFFATPARQRPPP